MTQRALSFGSVAADYERFRPGYPDELVDQVLAYAGTPVRTALEIGAGTGKATRAFVGRGIDVTATEPDPAMLDELRKHLPEKVVTVLSHFEDLTTTPAYDLVFAAASLHWTDSRHRWERVAGMLSPTGIFACFGGQRQLADGDLETAVDSVRSQFLADDAVDSPDGTPPDAPMQWPGTELTQSALFTDVRQSRIERRVELRARDYVGHLSTVSAYLQLADPVRQQVLARVLEVLPDRVTVVADITLHLASRIR